MLLILSNLEEKRRKQNVNAYKMKTVLMFPRHMILCASYWCLQVQFKNRKENEENKFIETFYYTIIFHDFDHGKKVNKNIKLNYYNLHLNFLSAEILLFKPLQISKSSHHLWYLLVFLAFNNQDILLHFTSPFTFNFLSYFLYFNYQFLWTLVNSN